MQMHKCLNYDSYTAVYLSNPGNRKPDILEQHEDH